LSTILSRIYMNTIHVYNIRIIDKFHSSEKQNTLGFEKEMQYIDTCPGSGDRIDQCSKILLFLPNESIKDYQRVAHFSICFDSDSYYDNSRLYIDSKVAQRRHLPETRYWTKKSTFHIGLSALTKE
jgi:hypothetical protein